MKIFVRDITAEIKEVNGKLPKSIIDDSAGSPTILTDPVLVKAKVNLAGDDIIVKVNLNSEFQSSCSRCLETVNAPWSEELWLDFNLNDVNDYIELDEDLRQEIVAGLPSIVLCDSECKGICPKCGVNLNKGKCRCKVLSTKY